MLPKSTVNGVESTDGLAKSNPAMPINASTAEPANVKPKLTKNWMDSRLSRPNIRLATIADRTNIHANPQINAADPELDASQLASMGVGPAKAVATVLTAVCVKIW